MAPEHQGREEERGVDDDVAEKDRREEGRLREGVNRLHDAAAGQERAEEAQRIRETDQQQVPGFQVSTSPLMLNRARSLELKSHRRVSRGPSSQHQTMPIITKEAIHNRPPALKSSLWPG